MSKENGEQSRCGPDRSYDPLPGPSLPGEDRSEVGLTGRNRDFAPRRQVFELILTWRDQLLDGCDLSTTIFRRNVRQGAVFLPRPPPLSPSGQVDISDVAFTSRERLPGRERPGKPIPDLAPDLAVEILSKGNTKAEMKRKLAEYFQAGTRQVWPVDPRKRTVRVHTSPDQSVLLEEGDTLLAGDILPGFRLVSTDLFPTPRRSENHPDSCAAWLLEGLSLQRLKPCHCSWGSVREVPSIRRCRGSDCDEPGVNSTRLLSLLGCFMSPQVGRRRGHSLLGGRRAVSCRLKQSSRTI